MRKQKIRVFPSSDSDLIGDYYALARTSTKLSERTKECIDNNYFLEAIGLVYMRLSDEIDNCYASITKLTKTKYNPREFVSKKLNKLRDYGIIDKKIFYTTKKFMDIRNDVVHNRWDRSIKKFRNVCEQGIILEGHFSGISYELLNYSELEEKSIRDIKLVVVNANGNLTTAQYKPNKRLLKALEKLSKNPLLKPIDFPAGIS